MEELKSLFIALGWVMLVIGGIGGLAFLIKGGAEQADNRDALGVRAELDVARADLGVLRLENQRRREERERSNKQIAELQAEVEILKARTTALVDGADDAVFGAWVDRADFDALTTRVQRLEEREATITVGLMKTCDFALPDDEDDEDDLDTIEDGDEDGEAAPNGALNEE